MILVDRVDFENLVKEGILDVNDKDRKFRITNKNKKGSRKKYYVIENKKVLTFLGRN